MQATIAWAAAHRPRPISTTSHVLATLARYDADPRRPMTDEQTLELMINYRIAFSHMLNGRTNEENWAICVCSLNIALVLAEWGIGEEYIPHINQSLEGAFRAKVRAGKTGKWGFDGPAIQAIKQAFEIHDEQLKLATKFQARDAVHEVHRRDADGNAYKEET